MNAMPGVEMNAPHAYYIIHFAIISIEKRTSFRVEKSAKFSYCIAVQIFNPIWWSSYVITLCTKRIFRICPFFAQIIREERIIIALTFNFQGYVKTSIRLSNMMICTGNATKMHGTH